MLQVEIWAQLTVLKDLHVNLLADTHQLGEDGRGDGGVKGDEQYNHRA